MLFCEARPFQNSDALTVHHTFRGRQHVHLMSDDERELRLYAQSIGMSVRWLQRDDWGLAHFDCTGKFMDRVMRDEKVTKLSRVEFVKTYKGLRSAAASTTS